MWRIPDDAITDGSIPRVLVVLAAPLIAQNLIHIANALVDTFWLGRLGEDEVAAVGLNFPVISIVIGGVTLIAIGTQITVAQRVGAGEHEAARRLVVTGLITAIGIGILIAGTFAVGADWLMQLLADDPAVGHLASLYLFTLMLFYPLTFASETLENAFIGWGDTAVVMYVNIVLVGVNIVLDPFLIFGIGPFPALGVQGAAVATGCGIVAGLLVAVAFTLERSNSFSLDRASITYRWAYVREIVKVGAPLSGQSLARDVSRVFIIWFVALAGGAAGVAAFTVGIRVSTLAVVPAIGLQQAAQAMIGQNVGADRPRRAWRTTTTGVLIATGGLAILGAVQWFIPGLIVDVLVPDLTPRGRELSVTYLQILALSYWALGASYLFLAGFNGAKRTRTSFVFDLLKYWGMRLPISLLAIPSTITVGIFGVTVAPGADLGIEAIFWIVTLSNIVAAPAIGAYFLYRTRDGMFQRAATRATGLTNDD